MKVWPFILIAQLACAQAFATMSAQVFEKGSARKNLLFTFEHVDDPVQGDVERGHSVYKSPTGQEAVIEKLEFKNHKLVHFELEQKQLGDVGEVKVEGDQATVSYTRKEGSKKSATLRWKDNSVIGPTLMEWVRGKWAQILKGDSVDVDFVVVDRLDSYTFRLSKVRDETVDGQKRIVVEMKPASRLIRLLVDPVYFHFSEDGARLMSSEGRTIPKGQKNGRFVDLDAETVYRYL